MLDIAPTAYYCALVHNMNLYDKKLLNIFNKFIDKYNRNIFEKMNVYKHILPMYIHTTCTNINIIITLVMKHFNEIENGFKNNNITDILHKLTEDIKNYT